MFDRVYRPLGVATAVALVFASPVMAQQISAKTAWEDLRGAALERGVTVASAGITDHGTTLVASDVRITSRDGTHRGVLTMDELRIEPRGEAVALIPSPRMLLTLRFGGGVERAFEIAQQGEITYRVTGDDIDLALDLSELGVEMIRAARHGFALDEAFSMSVGGLDSDLRATRDGAVRFDLDAERLDYGFAMDQRAGGGTIRSEGSATVETMHIGFVAEEMDELDGDDAGLARAFEAGFMARLEMTTGRTVGESLQIMDGQQIRLRQVAGGSELLAELVDGGFSLATTAGTGQLQGAFGPMQGEIAIGGATLDMAFPLVIGEGTYPFRLGLSLDALTPTAETLAMLGAQDFAGDSLSLALRIGADGRLTEELGEDFGEGDAPPIDLSDLRLEELSLSVGDAQLTGAGAFVFLGGLANSLQSDMPNGTGDFVFDLMGGDALLTRLAAAGLIPPDQQFFARMMMNGLGRPVGDDHLRAEVEIRPGGSVTVNGAPLPF